MKRLDLTPLFLGAGAIAMALISCGDKTGGDDGSMTTLPISTGGIGDDDGDDGGDDGDETGEKLDAGGGNMQQGCNAGDIGCTDQIDLLFVIDNSGTMGQEQLNLARNFPNLIEKLENLKDSGGNPVNADVQIMVTTSDFDNPLCMPFQPAGYEPAKGKPISSSCTSRLSDFNDLTGTVSVPQACTDVCPNAIEPGDPFLAFNGPTKNVPEVPAVDINGDGTPDSAIAQALACIGPQGINGCGYESQLESMMQALNPNAPWNSGAKPFLRPNALLAIAVVTDEVDCSVKKYEIMNDPNFQETNPDTNTKQPSSAICWNAGVECTGPDANGVFSECHSRAADDLQPISRYTDYLIKQLREQDKKEVIMLGILGVPKVTENSPEAPFHPIAGGVHALQYRNWRDGEYPTGDILPSEFAMNVTAADKQFDFGIGPGCTGQDPNTLQFTGQAIPPVRIKEVCESLNIDDTPEGVRCCIESICDEDFSDAINCLTGIISKAIVAPG